MGWVWGRSKERGGRANARRHATAYPARAPPASRLPPALRPPPTPTCNSCLNCPFPSLEQKGEGAAEAERRRLEARRAADRGRAAKTYYRLTVTDNGVGMAHDAIPDLLGRVLSGTKYGVCQTRGKFGLGAKMALIWSKMSTGLPIEVGMV